jgi:hypothetical protein
MEVHFKGRIFPSHKSLSISEVQKVGWRFDRPVSYTVEMEVKVQDAQVDIKCEVSEFTPVIARHLRSRAADYSNFAVSLITFASGLSFTVQLESCVFPDGTEEPIHLQADDVGKTVSAISVDGQGRLQGYADAFRAIFHEPQAVFALNDLTQCLSQP